MAINEASLIVVKGEQLLDATIVASLAILLSSAGVTHTHELPGPEVRVVVTKAMSIRAVVCSYGRGHGQACGQAHAMDAHN